MQIYLNSGFFDNKMESNSKVCENKKYICHNINYTTEHNTSLVTIDVREAIQMHSQNCETKANLKW